MRTLGHVRIVLWSAVIVALVGVGAATAWRAWMPASEAGSGEALVGGPFELINGTGETVTEADFAGKPFAIFFGFTYCPDVCPTSLFDMAGWIDALGEDADEMRFAFVTVDPERDTPEVMTAYVGSFSDRIVPLTGNAEQIAAVVETYRVYARKVPLEGGDYTMDHSAFVYLMGDDGRYRSHITYGEAPDRAVARLRELIADAA